MIESEGRFAHLPEWLLRSSDVSADAVRLYALLDLYAQSQSAIPNRASLQTALGISAQVLERARQELISVGALAEQETENGRQYVLRVLPLQLALPPPPAKVEDYRQVIAEWNKHAPPLISHTEGYYADYTARSAGARAIARHGVEAIQAAIRNYAHVLSNPEEFRWTHRYGFTEFCHRPRATPGVDYFIDAAAPLRNFQREDMSAQAIHDIFGSGGNDDEQ